jgi:hypothetical protein
LTKADEERFQKPNTVVAFIVGKADKQRAWFLPFQEWAKRHVDMNRRDERIYVRIHENADWLAKFEGDAGIRRAFGQLLPSSSA